MDSIHRIHCENWIECELSFILFILWELQLFDNAITFFYVHSTPSDQFYQSEMYFWFFFLCPLRSMNQSDCDGSVQLSRADNLFIFETEIKLVSGFQRFQCLTNFKNSQMWPKFVSISFFFSSFFVSFQAMDSKTIVQLWNISNDKLTWI